MVVVPPNCFGGVNRRHVSYLLNWFGWLVSWSEPLRRTGREVHRAEVEGLDADVRRTDAIEKAKADKGNEEVLKTDLQTASKRQAEIAEMTIRILERN